MLKPKKGDCYETRIRRKLSETIYLPYKQNINVRAIDVANELSFPSPAFPAPNLLKSKGYIHIENNVIT